jgi:hypothetical protein
MKKTFNEWLTEKGLDLNTVEVQKQAELLGEFNAEISKAIDEAIDTKIDKSEIDALKLELAETMTKANAVNVQILKDQGAALLTLQKQLAEDPSSDTLLKEVLEHKDALIKAVKENSALDFTVKANFLRASVGASTQSMRLESIGQLAHRSLRMYDLFNKVPVGTGSNGVIRYADWTQATVVRAAASVAEGATFPESTATFTEYSLSLEKIGDTIPMSEESLFDIPRFTRELENFLQVNVALVEDTQLLVGSGAANQMKGAYTSAGTYTPVASGIVDASIYDLLVKTSEDMMKDANSKYSANHAILNIVDINRMKLKKDGNNNYMMPPFVTDSGMKVDNMTIIESNAMVANTCMVMDSRFGTIYEVEGFSITAGHVANQFKEDLVTLKAKKREALLIRSADLGGFKKVVDIDAALVLLAT